MQTDNGQNGKSNGSGRQLATVPRAASGDIVRSSVGGTELERRGETASSVLAAQAKAAVEAAYLVAVSRPRDIDQVRTKLLKACQRPAFAAEAWYRKPVGKEKNKVTGQWEEKIAEGLSIRFAEEAHRTMGNLKVETITVYDDEHKRITKNTTTDLETNAAWSKDVLVEKITERKKLKDGQMPIATRVNSYGDTVFIVAATADEVDKQVGAITSKVVRDQICRLVPADIKAECEEAILATMANEAAEDPDAAKKRILDAFARVGVEPVHLKEYLGHSVETVSPAEIVELRAVFTGIKDGETTWAEVMQSKRDVADEQAGEARAKAGADAAAQATNGQKPSGLSGVAAASRAKREAQQPATKDPEPAKAERPKPEVKQDPPKQADTDDDRVGDGPPKEWMS